MEDRIGLYRILYGLSYLAVGVIVVLWLWIGFSMISAPFSPNPATGNIIPFNNHGTTHYVTRWQNRCSIYLIPIGISLAIVGSRMRGKVIRMEERERFHGR